MDRKSEFKKIKMKNDHLHKKRNRKTRKKNTNKNNKSKKIIFKAREERRIGE